MTWLIQLFLGNRIVRLIGAALVAVAGVLGYGALKKREGRVEARSEAEAARAKADQEAHERMNDADTGADLDDAGRVERLRDFAAKHGVKSPKAGGR